jgi:hypothetical protein
MAFRQRFRVGARVVVLPLLGINLVLGQSGVRTPTRSTAHPQKAGARSAKTTITELVKSSAKFSGKRVTVFASFHGDGIHVSVLMEPNCGRFDGTSKTPPPGGPQCYRGVVPFDSDKNESDPGSNELDRAMGKGLRGTEDKYITAEFTGVFRCVPSCTAAKWFKLELERVDKLEVAMKDMRPHRPTE